MAAQHSGLTASMLCGLFVQLNATWRRIHCDDLSSAFVSSLTISLPFPLLVSGYVNNKTIQPNVSTAVQSAKFGLSHNLSSVVVCHSSV